MQWTIRNNILPAHCQVTQCWKRINSMSHSKTDKGLLVCFATAELRAPRYQSVCHWMVQQVSHCLNLLCCWICKVLCFDNNQCKEKRDGVTQMRLFTFSFYLTKTTRLFRSHSLTRADNTWVEKSMMPLLYYEDCWHPTLQGRYVGHQGLLRFSICHCA